MKFAFVGLSRNDYHIKKTAHLRLSSWRDWGWPAVRCVLWRAGAFWEERGGEGLRHWEKGKSDTGCCCIRGDGPPCGYCRWPPAALQGNSDPSSRIHMDRGTSYTYHRRSKTVSLLHDFRDVRDLDGKKYCKLMCRSTFVHGKRQEILLCAEGEGGAGDRGGQVQAFGDLPPDLLVYHLHQTSLLSHQLIQHVQIQHLLGHDGDSIHRCAWRRQNGQEPLFKFSA